MIQCHGPTSFAVGEAEEVPSLQMSKDHDKDFFLSIYIFVAQTYNESNEEEERRSNMKKILKSALFGDIY